MNEPEGPVRRGFTSTLDDVDEKVNRLFALVTESLVAATDSFLAADREEARSVADRDEFIDALEKAYGHIGRHPATGSPRYAHELNLPGLRAWPLTRYPYIVFYVERSDHIDVWRVLHGQRDIPAWMQEPDAV